MQQPDEMERPAGEQAKEPKPKNKTRGYLDKMDAKHQHRFRPRNIFIGVAVASVIVFVVEVLILGFH
jgi:hypothetical protein